MNSDQGSTPEFARLSVEQYHAMIPAGILHEGAPIELIGGLLIKKDRRDGGGDIDRVGPRHATTVNILDRELHQVLKGSEFHLRTQQPTTLSGVDEPEPDVSIVAGAIRDYMDRHPGPAEVALVIEVADSSLRFDRTTKLPIYAAAGISVYWIVNLAERVIEVHEHPLTGQKRYASRVVYSPGDAVTFALGGREYAIRVDDVLHTAA